MKLVKLEDGLGHVLDIEKLNDNSIIVDAGSNIGKFINKIRNSLNLNCKIYAIEPSTRNITFIKSNNFANIEIMQKALTGTGRDSCTLTEFVGQKKSDGTNRYHQWNNVLGNHKEQMQHRKDVQLIEYDVECLAINDILMLEDVENIDYLKMDIEGSEYEVIESLTQEQADKIFQISIELHDQSRDSKLIKKLNNFGFETKLFPPNELYAFKKEND